MGSTAVQLSLRPQAREVCSPLPLCPLPSDFLSLRSTSPLPVSRLGCPAAPGAASPHRGFCHSRAGLRGGCRGHRCRLPQVLPGPACSRGLARASLEHPTCSRGPWWAQALPAAKALSSPHPWPHPIACLSPGRSPWGPSPLSPLRRDAVTAVTTICGTRHQAMPGAPCPSCEPESPLNRGSCLRPHLHPAPSRKQRHGSDSEYAEKLQQYSESVSSSCPPPPSFPWSLQGLEIPFSLPGISSLVLLS